MIIWVEHEFGPLRTGEWPFMFMSQHEFLARVTHVELNRRLFVPPGVFILQEMPEEVLL